MEQISIHFVSFSTWWCTCPPLECQSLGGWSRVYFVPPFLPSVQHSIGHGAGEQGTKPMPHVEWRQQEGGVKKEERPGKSPVSILVILSVAKILAAMLSEDSRSAVPRDTQNLSRRSEEKFLKTQNTQCVISHHPWEFTKQRPSCHKVRQRERTKE